MKAFLAASLPSLLPGLGPAGRRPLAEGAPAPRPDHGDPRARWEWFYAAEDPWGYGASAYERTKYGHTLEVLPPGRLGRALELACAEGHFTALLAPRVGELLATDISTAALGRAAERCRGLPHVRFAPLDLARDPLPGRFGLVVASEVFYYLKDRGELARVARKVAAALEPGGLFLTAHARTTADEPDGPGFDWPVGFGAATIGATFASLPDLEPVRELRTPLYRVALFRRRASPRRWRRPVAPEVLEREPSWPEEPALAGHVVRPGEFPARAAADAGFVTRRLPVLMYHRIAADGPAALAACRVHPERLEAQLDWLRSHGFRSVGLDAWLGAADRRFGELPGRAVCLTFDDGYEDFAEVAWPLLRRYGFGATVFLVADLVGRAAAWDAHHGPPAPLMGWATVGRLAREGVAFGGHTATHPYLTRVGPDRLAEELRRSKAALEGRLGLPVRAFAYPFGFVDGLARNAAAAAGYAVAVTTRHGHARWGDDPLLLPRIMVTDADDPGTLARRLGRAQRAPRPRRLRPVDGRCEDGPRAEQPAR